MKWLKWHLRKPLSFVILYIVIMGFGLLSLNKIQFSVSPGKYSPIITVKTEYFGMDSLYIEKNITIPIENALSSLKGIESIHSISQDGESIVRLKIHSTRPIKQATLEIKSTVDSLRSGFPDDVQEPVISHYDPSQIPVMILSFYPHSNSSLNLTEIRQEVSMHIKPILQRVDGVADIVVTGGKQKEIAVVSETERVMTSGLQFQDLNFHLQQNNESIFLGSLLQGGDQIPVYSWGKYQDLMDLGQVAVKTLESNESGFQALGRLADIDFHHKRIDSLSRINGTERVSLYIQNRSGANILALCHDLNLSFSILQNLDYAWEVDFDQSLEIRESLRNLVVSILMGILLLLIVVLPFLRHMNLSLLTLLPLPVSLAATFITAAAFNIELNAVIMTGIALGSGLLVDNGLVIMDFLRAKSRRSAMAHTLSVVRQLQAPLLSSLLTTICVFVPLLLSSPETRYMYLGFSVILFILLAASFFLAIGPLPLAYLKTGASHLPVLQPVKWIRRTGVFYTRIIKYGMHHRRWINQMALFLLAVSIAAIGLRGFGFSSGQSVEKFYAYVEPEAGTSVEQTDVYSRDLEALLLQEPAIKKVITKVEKAHASLIMTLKKPIGLRRFDKYIQTLKTKSAVQVDCFVYFSYDQGGGENHEIDIQFVGEDPATIQELSREASSLLYRSPAFNDVILRFKSDDPVYTITPDLAKIQLSGLTVKNIIDEARIYLFGVISSKYNPEGQGILDIRILSRDALENKTSLDNLLNLKIRNSSHDLVPLRDLVSHTNTTANSKIYRVNKRRTYTITARLESSHSLSRGLAIIRSHLDQMRFPPGYYWQFDNKYNELQENNRHLLTAMILAVFFTFITLVILYENVRRAVLTLAAIPFILPGTAVALLLFHFSLSTPVFIALILLAGITVNNSVLILSDLKPGCRPVQIIHLSRKKLNSILLTTLSTIAAILPMLFTPGSGQYLWHPFALTVILGLLTSTLFSLLVLPLLAAESTSSRQT